MQEAVEAARGGFDGFVGIGGGSALDTAKLCALFATHGGELLDYVNAPIGAGRAVPGPVLPVVALPTTSGTGSEVTTVAIVDFPRLGTKTGISHRTSPPGARDRRPVPDRVVPAGRHRVDRHRRAAARARGVHGLGLRHAAAPSARPAAAVPGREPVLRSACASARSSSSADISARAVSDGDDIEARTAMALASTIAGIAFSGAGVHIPHALAYPIASLKHEWTTAGVRRRGARPARLRRRRDRARRVPVHRRTPRPSGARPRRGCSTAATTSPSRSSG